MASPTGGRRVVPGRIRWLARRPRETLPVPQRRSAVGTPTPRYTQPPRWGLHQDFTGQPSATGTDAVVAGRSIQATMRVAAAVVGVAAVVTGLAYVLLVINRSGPISRWLAWTAELAVLFTGGLAVVAAVAVFIAAERWLWAARAQAYDAIGTRDRLPRWRLRLYCWVPLVNLFTAPVLALELVRAQNRAAHSDPLTDRRALFIRRWWVGWIALSIVSVGCVAYTWSVDSLQSRADGMVYTAAVYAAAAAFLLVSAQLVRAIDGGPVTGAFKEGRWLAV